MQRRAESSPTYLNAVVAAGGQSPVPVVQHGGGLERARAAVGVAGACRHAALDSLARRQGRLSFLDWDTNMNFVAYV